MAASTVFCQFVVGSPGAGKTAYCRTAAQALANAGRRVALVNLDPAADPLPEAQATHGVPSFDVDVRELVDAVEVAERLELGPNGSLLFCMEYLEQNLEWLKTELREKCGLFQAPDPQSTQDNTQDSSKQGQDSVKNYLIIDCPGQVELFTHHTTMRKLCEIMTQTWGFRLCVVHLVDSVMCSDVGNFISALLTSLSCMMQLEMPHVNVLSKIDLAEAYGKLPFGLEFYTEVLDLRYLLDLLQDDPFTRRYRQLNAALMELVEDFALVQFQPLSIRDSDSFQAVMRVIDKASGYLYSDAAHGVFGMESAVFPAQPAHESSTARAQERYFDP